MAALGATGVFERELETAHLQRAVDHSWHGVGRVVVIEGPAGIGKTTLIGAARELAREAGMNVRVARGAELEQSFAFGVVRQLFDPLIAAAADAQRREWLSGAAELAAPLFDARGPMYEPQGGDSIYPLLHGLYWMCSNLAREQPLALCLDDAQWADEPSLVFLGFLARRLEELPILHVATVRSMAPDVPVSLAALRADPEARVLTPRELSAAGVERLLGSRIGDGVDEAFARACHDATAGNPFLLSELVLALQEGGIAPRAANAPGVGSLAPQRVADAVLARLGRVSPSAPSLARAVAILGDGAALSTAAALAGQDEQSAIQTAAAMRAGDLFGDGTGLSFAHPIIRAAIYQSVLPAERGMRHAQAAALLNERNAPADQVAAQILLADGLNEPWVIEQLQLAAGAAMVLGVPSNAVAYLARALEVEQGGAERAALLARLGHAEVLAGLADGPAHLEEALRLTSDPAERARLAIMLAQFLKFTGGAQRAVELLSEIETVDDRGLEDRIEIESLSAALISQTAHELLAERIGAVRDAGRGGRSERERFELVLLAFERMLDNRPVAEILDLLARAGSGPGSVDERIVQPPGLVTRGVVLIYCDRLEEAGALFTDLAERSRKRGSMTSLVLGLSLRAEVAYRHGDLGQALADASSAFELSSEIASTSPVLRVHPIGVINNVAAERDHSDSELDELLLQTDQNLDRDTMHASLTLHSRARLLLARGRPEAALDQLRALGALGRTFGSGTPAFIAWRSSAALILKQLGDQATAQQLAAEEVELARAMGAPRAVGVALRAHALVQSSPAIDELREAVGGLERSPARLEYARALVDLGATMRRAGDRSASRDPLREGHDLAVLCGAGLLAERARQEIAATGARVAPAGLQGVAALTPSERRVAELAAQGQTNRDIAQTLFVTEKTVETHLRHVYDKLGVRSRHKLAALIAEPEATPA